MYITSCIIENVLIIIHLNTIIMKSTTCYDCINCAPVYNKRLDKKGNVVIDGYFCVNPLINKPVTQEDISCDDYEPLEL